MKKLTLQNKTLKRQRIKEYPLPLDLYLSERLTDTEFFSALKLAVTGDQKSRNDIVLSYIPFIMKVIKGMLEKYINNINYQTTSKITFEERNWNKKEDLFTSGVIGMIDAIDRFKIEWCNNSSLLARKLFFGYVKKYIQGYVRRDIKNQCTHIRIQQKALSLLTSKQKIKVTNKKYINNIENSFRAIAILSNENLCIDLLGANRKNR